MLSAKFKCRLISVYNSCNLFSPLIACGNSCPTLKTNAIVGTAPGLNPGAFTLDEYLNTTMCQYGSMTCSVHKSSTTNNMPQISYIQIVSTTTTQSITIVNVFSSTIDLKFLCNSANNAWYLDGVQIDIAKLTCSE